MTDKEILTAVDFCLNDCGKECPYFNIEGLETISTAECMEVLIADMYTLINRQQESIKDLNETVENLLKQYKTLYADAINEFVEKLKTWHSYDRYDIAGHKQKQIVISEVGLDKLVKEMVGADNG